MLAIASSMATNTASAQQQAKPPAPKFLPMPQSAQRLPTQEGDKAYAA
jgi:hypothetical protein